MGEIQRASKTQRGAIAIMFAFTLMIMLGVIGIAIDTARLYNRQVELQNIADAVALAAANELNGTSAGVTKAVTKASQAAESLMYQYHTLELTWSSTALKFSTSAAADATWMDSGAASASASGISFAKVDTSEFGAEVGLINTAFMHIFSSSLGVVNMSGRAVAGRSALNVTPLAICAKNTNPGTANGLELLEYGFRRGVSYDLMDVDPASTTDETFVMSPVDPPGVVGSSDHTAATLVEPFVCAGKMSMPRITGEPITVARPFPIDSLFNALNSRFDKYVDSACKPDGAPPDANIKPYLKSSIPWMTSVVDQQTDTATNYGPLWTNARAVEYSSYTAGEVEPAAGYSTFSTSAWPTLYPKNTVTGKPEAKVAGSYPASSPYKATAGANFLSPLNKPGVRNRRVLQVALLSCPVLAGSATANVLAIGKFFMTVPATPDNIYAEFAGIAQEQALGGPVELYK